MTLYRHATGLDRKTLESELSGILNKKGMDFVIFTSSVHPRDMARSDWNYLSNLPCLLQNGGPLEAGS